MFDFISGCLKWTWMWMMKMERTTGLAFPPAGFQARGPQDMGNGPIPTVEWVCKQLKTRGGMLSYLEDHFRYPEQGISDVVN